MLTNVVDVWLLVTMFTLCTHIVVAIAAGVIAGVVVIAVVVVVVVAMVGVLAIRWIGYMHNGGCQLTWFYLMHP